MAATPHGWKIFDAHAPVLTYEYSFGPGTANALAAGGEGGLFVVSPPCGVAGGVFDDLAAYGPVRATGSAPGLRFNNIAPLFMVRNKTAHRRWLAEEAAKEPPRWLIPAHGDIVDWSAHPDGARRFLSGR